MKHRVRALTGRSRGRSIATVLGNLRSYLLGWKSYFRLAETPRVFRSLDSWIRHRLRAVQLKHWSNASTVYREVRKRGLPDSAARRVAANTTRWWKNAGLAISVAIPPSYFDGLGLPRLAP